eukprot:CAMPEP_0168334614 /NCGR_PEP_ID=MMETSP0213-20121227/10388_1 /TAXON_ID=151035 /ORGANISM="Euplotes harpa, Strain FSP1.4" /LENGTH=188 /DNA_ID=CAMNT_0008339323 /DNA_START=192 /DNA_END=755 /DNA_ORIENTATION=-
MAALLKNFPPWVDNARVAVGLVSTGVFWSRWRTKRDKALVVHGSALSKNVPMHLASGLCERSGEDQDLRAHFSAQDLREVGESHVVADADTELAVLGIEHCEARPWFEEFALFESRSPGDVNVEKMHFAVLCREVSVLIKASGRIVHKAVLSLLRNGSADDADAVSLSHLAEHPCGGGILVLGVVHDW